MKSITLIIMLVISTSIIAQQTTPAINTGYLNKSKHQKTIAWMLAGGGTVVAIVSMSSFNWINIFGTIIDPDNPGEENIKRGETTFYIGCIAALTSIPFFIAASRNKKKSMSLSFKNEKIQTLEKGSFAYKFLPSVGLTIRL